MIFLKLFMSREVIMKSVNQQSLFDILRSGLRIDLDNCLAWCEIEKPYVSED